LITYISFGIGFMLLAETINLIKKLIIRLMSSYDRILGKYLNEQEELDERYWQILLHRIDIRDIVVVHERKITKYFNRAICISVIAGLIVSALIGFNMMDRIMGIVTVLLLISISCLTCTAIYSAEEIKKCESDVIKNWVKKMSGL